jgi:SAM-dependent methyltransferase
MIAAETKFRKEREAHWDEVAGKNGGESLLGCYYHRKIAEFYRFLIPPGRKVLELGCGAGRLLAALNPSHGVGVDISSEMISLAARNHPQLTFYHDDAHQFESKDEFDFIILSDLTDDLWDVQGVLEKAYSLCGPTTQIIVNSYSLVWELPIRLARKTGLATPNLPQNWLTVEDLAGLFKLTGFSVVRHGPELLFPFWLPVVSDFVNRYPARIWPFKFADLTNFIIARPEMVPSASEPEPIVSVIIPARNESGNITDIFARVPKMGRETELVFVEGGSEDDTYEAIQNAISNHPQIRSRLLKQTGVGKGDAVRLGFSKAKGDVLMILDADLTVPPEDLPRFYAALRKMNGSFINGVRLVYPMEKKAMRFFNLLGNKFFSLAFSWLLGQSIKDTLCGTKVLARKDYETIAENRAYFGDFDPFGDFDLIFGAAKQNLRIIDLPIRYRERLYGDTNISRWKHGVILLRMVLFAARRIKFF